MYHRFSALPHAVSNKFMAELWERTVLAIIGESLENAEHINGFVISGSKINVSSFVKFIVQVMTQHINI